MKADELIKDGQLDQALAALKDTVRSDPADWTQRVFLFQLLSVCGDWESALGQLNIAADMNSECQLLAQMYRPVLSAEALRAEIFKGQKKPLFLGEPDEWLVWLTHALSLFADSKLSATKDLRNRAFEAAPATSGEINGEPFEWIADADSRLGPVIEAVIDGKYYWVPFTNIRDIRIEKPQDLRDTIWIKAYFTWVNEGQSAGLIPVRYTYSESSSDDAVKLSRKTDWIDHGDDLYTGLGQRMFATDSGDYSLLEVRRIELNVD